MIKKILLTGSSGFLGQHILKKIGSKKNISIEIFSFREHKIFNKEIEFLMNNLSIENYDYIINAGSSQNSNDDFEGLKDLILSNILFPATILSTINQSKLKTHFINFGSSWEFCSEGKKMPFNAYAASKTALESFFKHYSQNNLKITNLYLYDTYGPNDKRGKVVNLIIDAMIKNEDLNMSGCQQFMDLIFIDDVVDAVNFLLTDKFNNIYKENLNYFELRSGNPMSLEDLIIKIKKFFPKYSGNINKGFYPYRNRERFNLKKFEYKLNTGLEFTDLDTGLTKTISSRKNNYKNK